MSYRCTIAAVFTLLVISSQPSQARFISPDPSDPLLPGVGTNRYTYSGGDPTNRGDPSGLADVYFGGLGERTRGARVSPVGAHMQEYRNNRPGRTIGYFNQDQVGKAVDFINRNVSQDEPLNLIGHSYGADAANETARRLDRPVDNLVGVDPVGKFQPFGSNGARPVNVKRLSL